MPPSSCLLVLMLSSWDQRFEISCSELVFSSAFSDCRRSTFHKHVASVHTKKHLHCNFVATNATCAWYLLHQLFFSLLQGSRTFQLLLQCHLVTCNQLLNCTWRGKDGNLGNFRPVDCWLRSETVVTMLHFLLGLKMHLGCNAFTTTELLQSFQLSQAHVVQVLIEPLVMVCSQMLKPN